MTIIHNHYKLFVKNLKLFILDEKNNYFALIFFKHFKIKHNF